MKKKTLEELESQQLEAGPRHYASRLRHDHVYPHPHATLFAGVVIGILIAVIFTAVYISNMIQKSSKTMNIDPYDMQNINKVSPIPTVVRPIDISNWKTYTNIKFGYSFKYPNNYSFVGDEHSIIIDLETEGPTYPLFYINLIGKDQRYGQYNSDDFTNNIDKYLEINVGEIVSPPRQPFQQTFIRQPDVLIDNKNAKVFEGEISGMISPSENNWKDRRLIVTYNNHAYILGTYYIKNHETWNLYQQILSTFKFIQ